MKSQGSILIEVVASIMVLMLTTTFIISASIQNNEILKERILLEEVNRAVCNLSNEFKYNMPTKEIEGLLSNGEVGLKYDSDFSRRLLDTDIENLEQGEDIKVSLVGKDSIGLKLKIEANIKMQKNEINVQREFTKSWWMDEI